MKRFNFIKILNSPFKPFRLKWYIGKTQIGVPYFFPRKVCKKTNTFVTKKIGFDSCDLGWKTKWSDTDYRYEWSPVFSFVFFGYQMAVMVLAPDPDSDHSYWECWLYYYYNTDKTKSKKERIEQCMREYPQMWTIYHKKPTEYKETINKYEHILKKKYLTNE